MKIYFHHTSARIAQLHALGFVTHPEYQVVPLVSLWNKSESETAETDKANPEWHQLVPLEKLDKNGDNNPEGILLRLKEQQKGLAQPLAQAA